MKQPIRLTQHAQHLHDLDMVVEWALRGHEVTLNKGGNIINLHSDNVKGM